MICPWIIYKQCSTLKHEIDIPVRNVLPSHPPVSCFVMDKTIVQADFRPCQSVTGASMLQTRYAENDIYTIWQTFSRARAGSLVCIAIAYPDPGDGHDQQAHRSFLSTNYHHYWAKQCLWAHRTPFHSACTRTLYSLPSPPPVPHLSVPPIDSACSSSRSLRALPHLCVLLL